MGQLVTKTIPGLYNGVSQQAVTMRLDTQGELQENAMGTIVDGLYTRPNTEHIAALPTVSLNSFVHTINRDPSEQYQVYINGGADEPIQVYKLDGTKCTVRYGTLDGSLAFTEDLAVKDYLNTAVARPKAYKALSIADYTLIVNRTVITAMASNVWAGTVKGVVASFLDLPQEWEFVDAYNAAKEYTKGDLCKSGGFIYYFINNTDTAGKAVTDVAYWRKEDKYATTGEIYEVTGDPSNNFDNYFVKFTGDVWQETLAPGEKYILNQNTLPHRLVRTGVDQFTFAPCLWENRVVGDEDSCPVPSFIGKPITNITFFKNRLGLFAKDTFFLSRAGRYFELFGETAIDLLDDDPIDLLASSTSVVNLVSSIPFDKNLLVNSEMGQFSFGSSGTTLSPSTATITPTTQYSTDKDSDPVAAGANVYFVNPRNQYVSIMEYLIQPDTLTEDAADITSHCPHYIPNGTIKMVSCIPMDMLLVYSTGDSSSLYVYKYYWMGNEKPQSAWSKWTFDGTIVGMGLIDTTLYLTIDRGNVVMLEKMQLENIVTDARFDFRICLDRQVGAAGTYDVNTDKTTFTLPYLWVTEENLMGIDPNRGFPMNILDVNTATKVVTVRGDYNGMTCVFGEKYRMRYRFSEWYVKDSNKIAVIDGKLQIRTLTLSYRDTGEFAVEVTPLGRETISKPFSGVVIGASTMGAAEPITGEERFPILAKSKYTTIDIVSDAYIPCNIVSAAFEGMYVIRSQRI